jgi:hypothetical protein
LGLNVPSSSATVDDGASVGASTFASSRYVSDDEDLRRQAREERRALKAARQQIEAALASLPAPQFEYELAAPEVETVDDDEDNESAKVKRPLDQADLEAAERSAKRLKAERELEARSTVLKRPELPRPSVIDPSAVVVESTSHPDAAKLVQTELLRLLQHDAYAFPVAPPKNNAEMTPVPPTPVTLEPIELEALYSARELLEAETGDYTVSEDPTKVNAAANDLVFINGSWQEATEQSDRLASLKAQFTALDSATKELRKANDKAENKLTLAHGGYSKRSRALRDEILATVGATQNALIEQTIFEQLQRQESSGGAARIEKLEEEVKHLKSLEASLQKEYGDLRIERRRQELAKK